MIGYTAVHGGIIHMTRKWEKQRLYATLSAFSQSLVDVNRLLLCPTTPAVAVVT